MEIETLGHQLRALRTAAGRTVASVAAGAGLSVPYIANLENGRGNPTLTAHSLLAAALGCDLDVTLTASGGPAPGGPGLPSEVPASLVRFARTPRFRDAAATMAAARGADPAGFGRRLIPALAALAGTLNSDLSDTDWGRVLDALLLAAAHPHPDPRRERAGRGGRPTGDRSAGPA